MKTIMGYILLTIMAFACVVAICGIIYVLGDLAYCAPKHDRVRAQVVNSPPVSCAPDGVAITSEMALRYAVTQLDTMLHRGKDVLGNRVTPQDVTRYADGIAEEFPVPDVMLAKLDRCEAGLRESHSHGYWLLSAALVRAAAAKRQPDTGRAPRLARAGA